MHRSQTYQYPQPQMAGARYATTHASSSAFSASANANEDWTKISDLAERRRIQNRIAQVSLHHTSHHLPSMLTCYSVTTARSSREDSKTWNVELDLHLRHQSSNIRNWPPSLPKTSRKSSCKTWIVDYRDQVYHETFRELHRSSCLWTTILHYLTLLYLGTCPFTRNQPSASRHILPPRHISHMSNLSIPHTRALLATIPPTNTQPRCRPQVCHLRSQQCSPLPMASRSTCTVTTIC
jgi:hypothetical protein